jgi:2-hydroxy-3-oxopropionate reductase
MTLPTLAFLGIGLMGRPMSTRLLLAGYPLRAWNRTAAKAEALRELGAEPSADIRGAVDGAGIVISMLEAGPAVGDVIDAAAPALAQGALWIDMSSTRQDEAIAFAKRLAGHKVRFMDAPVSGGGWRRRGGQPGDHGWRGRKRFPAGRGGVTGDGQSDAGGAGGQRPGGQAV